MTLRNTESDNYEVFAVSKTACRNVLNVYLNVYFIMRVLYGNMSNENRVRYNLGILMFCF